MTNFYYTTFVLTSTMLHYQRLFSHNALILRWSEMTLKNMKKLICTTVISHQTRSVWRFCISRCNGNISCDLSLFLDLRKLLSFATWPSRVEKERRLWSGRCLWHQDGNQNFPGARKAMTLHPEVSSTLHSPVWNVSSLLPSQCKLPFVYVTGQVCTSIADVSRSRSTGFQFEIPALFMSVLCSSYVHVCCSSVVYWQEVVKHFSTLS